MQQIHLVGSVNQWRFPGSGHPLAVPYVCFLSLPLVFQGCSVRDHVLTHGNSCSFECFSSSVFQRPTGVGRCPHGSGTHNVPVEAPFLAPLVPFPSSCLPYYNGLSLMGNKKSAASAGHQPSQLIFLALRVCHAIPIHNWKLVFYVKLPVSNLNQASLYRIASIF